MKFRRTFRYHSLKRVRVRQTWNKYNLFNMHANMPIVRVIGRSFFQQKWSAKALTRGYHGEHIKERQWERMFSRRLPSVVNMNPRYMARFDGSEQAAGRGRGLQADPSLYLERDERFNPDAGTNQTSDKQTPYMQMTFAPMERRLDIAVFRAMFASSARQARQFVVHGAVTVNGKKMIYPGYLLNPGDMFQVDVERVLFATGAKKRTRTGEEHKQYQRALEAKEEAGQNGAQVDGADAATLAANIAAAEGAPNANKRHVRDVPYLANRVKKILEQGGSDLTMKRKKVLRNFVRSAEKWVAKATGVSTTSAAAPPPPASDIVARLADMLANLPPPSAAEEKGKGQKKPQKTELTKDERERFEQLLARDAENPYDRSKPYATPWRPRPFMQAFAYIPRYLEVNQNICAAVYLRHPVCRPGSSEVPTPFTPELSQLAFNWYLRRH